MRWELYVASDTEKSGQRWVNAGVGLIDLELWYPSKVIRHLMIVVLVLLLPVSSAEADFKRAKGAYGDWTLQIALGRFEIARGATRNEREVIALQTQRLKLLALIYHDVYDGMCPIQGPSRTFSQRIDTVRKTLTGRELDRTEGSTQSVTVRSEYVDVFSQGWQLAASPAQVVFTFGPGFAQQMADLAVTSRNLIQANGCSTPGLEIFEKNLAAIVRNQTSLQKRGLAVTKFKTECLAKGISGLSERSGKSLSEICSCLDRHFWKDLPEEWLAQVEDRFSREEVLLAAMLTPDSWEGTRACVN